MGFHLLVFAKTFMSFFSVACLIIIVRLIDRLIDWLILRSMNWLMNWWLIDWLIDCLIILLIAWLLIDCFFIRHFVDYSFCIFFAFFGFHCQTRLQCDHIVQWALGHGTFCGGLPRWLGATVRSPPVSVRGTGHCLWRSFLIGGVHKDAGSRPQPQALFG